MVYPYRSVKVRDILLRFLILEGLFLINDPLRPIHPTFFSSTKLQTISKEQHRQMKSNQKNKRLKFEFVKIGGIWYFYHPKYAKRQGSASSLTQVMKEGFHTLLEQAGGNASRIEMQSSDAPFEGCDELELTQPAKDESGGYYLLKTLYQQPYVLLIRFFDVRSFFGYLPAKLYIKLEPRS